MEVENTGAARGGGVVTVERDVTAAMGEGVSADGIGVADSELDGRVRVEFQVAAAHGNLARTRVEITDAQLGGGGGSDVEGAGAGDGEGAGGGGTGEAEDHSASRGQRAGADIYVTIDLACGGVGTGHSERSHRRRSASDVQRAGADPGSSGIGAAHAEFTRVGEGAASVDVERARGACGGGGRVANVSLGRVTDGQGAGATEGDGPLAGTPADVRSHGGGGNVEIAARDVQLALAVDVIVAQPDIIGVDGAAVHVEHAISPVGGDEHTDRSILGRERAARVHVERASAAAAISQVQSTSRGRTVANRETTGALSEGREIRLPGYGGIRQVIDRTAAAASLNGKIVARSSGQGASAMINASGKSTTVAQNNIQRRESRVGGDDCEIAGKRVDDGILRCRRNSTAPVSSGVPVLVGCARPSSTTLGELGSQAKNRNSEACRKLGELKPRLRKNDPTAVGFAEKGSEKMKGILGFHGGFNGSNAGIVRVRETTREVAQMR